MRERAIATLLLLWLVPLLTIVAAGHTRGALKLPGSDDAQAVLNRPSCALCELTFGGSKTDDEDTPTPPLDPTGSCAICEITGTLLLPEPVDFSAAALAKLPFPVAETVVAEPAPVPVLRELSGRAPPAMG